MTHVVHNTGQSTTEFVFEFQGNKFQVQEKKGEPQSHSELLHLLLGLFV